MNSIEAVDELEQRGPKDTRIGQRPRVPAPAEVMRLYLKDGNRYILQHEGDFQTVMKKAETLHQANVDVLVNEKADPLHVHAKSNIHNDVAVGREVSPVDKDGVYVKGKGEILLESFYEKLPLVDKVQPERTTPEERQPLFRAPAVEIPAPVPDAQALGKPTVDLDKTAAVDLDKERERDGATASAGKPILKKTGYQLPAHVADLYTVKGGRFIDKDSDKVRFEDHGKKLSTSLEDRAVIAHMVDVAAAKQWDRIELSGTQAFRQMAWLEAEARGIRTSGYEPSQQDLQQLTQAKNERGISIEASADEAKNNIAVSAERPIDVKNPSPERFSTELPAADRKGRAPASDEIERVDGATLAGDHAGSGKEVAAQGQPDIGAKSSEQAGPIVGRLVAHGRDNYNHDPDEKPSYFVTVATTAGERKIWGKDLERSMAGGEFQKGDAIALERKGYEPVTVDANVRDDAGKVVGKEEISAQRNVWEVQGAGLVILRPMSDQERLRVEAAYKVLDDALSQQPKELRREVISRFTDSVEKGQMDLPTPMTTQMSVERSPEPALEPELEVDQS